MRIAAPPRLTEYLAKDAGKLSQDLSLVDDYSVFEPVSDPREIMLGPDCKTVMGKSVLSTVALSQICRTICPGLIKVVLDLSGISCTGSERPAQTGLALDVYNSLVRNRFDLMEAKSLVRDLKTRRIDGIIGAGYRQLSNMEFYNMVQDSISVDSVPMKFQRAALLGRTLVMCYTQARSFTTEPEPYSLGLYFSNSEVGDCSVKIADMVYRTSTNERAIRPVRRGRLIHTGRDFSARVRKAVYNACNNFNNYSVGLAKKLKGSLKELPTCSLGFQGLNEKEAHVRIDELVSRLARRGLGSQLAERALYSALYQGLDSSVPKKYEISIKRSQWGTRTGYDLFVALIRDAAGRSLSVRESEEKVAYDLLLNRSAIVKEKK